MLFRSTATALALSSGGGLPCPSFARIAPRAASATRSALILPGSPSARSNRMGVRPCRNGRVTAAASAVRNVTTCVERCHLHVKEIVANPFAAGLAALVSDEADFLRRNARVSQSCSHLHGNTYLVLRSPE